MDEKVREVGVKWGVEVPVGVEGEELMRKGWCQTQREHPQSLAGSEDHTQTTHLLDCGRGDCPVVSPGL